ncbi:SLC22A5 [Branchiostoma lanceolatum]|uniref:SLC22A5 protein n=1 Tax=Branchiostoma lanceolatum TaxID=7740 RepID=A0A8J9VJZ3_BRALA|nr:SLC22A5 [Branchiostoma lanceolatum]
MGYDAILQYLGDFGPFQRRTALLLLLGNFQTGMHIAVMTFIGAIPDHHCRVAETGLSAYNTTWPEALNFSIPMEEVDETWRLSSCRRYSSEVISGNFTTTGCPGDSQHGNLTSACCESGWDYRNGSTTGCTEGWEYDRSQYHSSVVMQYNLVCERAWLRELAQSIFMAGVATGGFIFGVLSDRCGRHRTLLVCVLLLVTCGTGLAFTSNLAAFIALRFILGAAQNGLQFTTLVTGTHRTDCSSLHWSQVRTERTAVHYTGHRYAQNGLQFTTLVTGTHRTDFSSLHWSQVRTERTAVHYTSHRYAQNGLQFTTLVTGTHRTDCSSLHWSQVRTERTSVHYTSHRYAQNGLQFTTLVTERTAVHYTGHRYAQNGLQFTTLVIGTHRTDCSSLHWSQVRTERTAVHYTGHRYAQNGLQFTTLVTGMETIGTSWRMAFGICSTLCPSVGYALLGILAYVIRDWWILQLAITSPGVLSLIAWWFIPESPRWLLLNNKVEQWRKTIQQIAKYNGIEVPAKMYEYVESSTSSSGTANDVGGTPGDSKRNYNLLDLVRTPNMRRITVTIIFASFNALCVYVGLLFGTSQLAGSHYVNFILGACVETVAVLTAGVTMQRWGRKPPTVAFSLLAGVSCLATAAIPNDIGHVATALATVGRFGASSTLAILDIYCTELFPTVVRHMGVGTTIMVSRVGGIVAPFLSLLGNVWRPLPLMTLGVLSCVTSMVVTVLPETHDVPLPNTLEDGEHFGRNSPPSPTRKFNCGAIPQKTFADGRTVYEGRAECGFMELVTTV